MNTMVFVMVFKTQDGNHCLWNMAISLLSHFFSFYSCLSHRNWQTDKRLKRKKLDMRIPGSWCNTFWNFVTKDLSISKEYCLSWLLTVKVQMSLSSGSVWSILKELILFKIPLWDKSMRHKTAGLTLGIIHNHQRNEDILQKTGKMQHNTPYLNQITVQPR